MKSKTLLLGQSDTWKSHKQIFPVLFRLLSKLTRAEAHSEVSKDSSDSIIASVPLFRTLPSLRKLREKNPLSTRALILESTHMAAGGFVYAENRKGLRASDHFVVTSTAERKVVERMVKARVHVIPQPVQYGLPASKTKAQRIRLKKTFPWDHKKEWVLYVGRLCPEKNIHGLIEAFSLLCKKRRGVHLLIRGDFVDSLTAERTQISSVDYQASIQDLIEKLGLDSDVSFIPQVSNQRLRSLMSCSDLMASLTLYHREDFGYALAQGFSQGTPSVVSLWGGGLDFVRVGAALGVPVFEKNGRPCIDTSTAAKQMERALAAKQNQKLRRKAIRYFKEELSLKAVENSWKLVLQKWQHQPVSKVGLRVSKQVHDYYLDCLSKQTNSRDNPLSRRHQRLLWKDYGLKARPK